MPWCDRCDRFLSPNTVADDGSCPSCGTPVAKPSQLDRARKGRGSSPDALAARAEREAREDAAPGDDPGMSVQGPDQPDEGKAPWHFKLLMVALVLYLGYRLFQGFVWLGHHL